MSTLFDVDPTPALPALTGSQAQIDWAEKIRSGKLRHVREEVKRLQALRAQMESRGHAERAEEYRRKVRQAMTALEKLERAREARFWIDRRDDTADELITEACGVPEWLQ